MRATVTSGMAGGTGAGNAVGVKRGEVGGGVLQGGVYPSGVKSCQKCKKDLKRKGEYPKVYVRYCSGRSCLYGLARVEHMDVTCLDCSFKWAEALP